MPIPNLNMVGHIFIELQHIISHTFLVDIIMSASTIESGQGNDAASVPRGRQTECCYVLSSGLVSLARYAQAALLNLII